MNSTTIHLRIGDRVADLLLASEGVNNSWVDLVDGEEAIDAAVARVVNEGVDAAEGEDF
jgi:hypothetical protein